MASVAAYETHTHDAEGKIDVIMGQNALIHSESEPATYLQQYWAGSIYVSQRLDEINRFALPLDAATIA